MVVGKRFIEVQGMQEDEGERLETKRARGVRPGKGLTSAGKAGCTDDGAAQRLSRATGSKGD